MQTRTEPAAIGSTIRATLRNSLGQVLSNYVGTVVKYTHNTDEFADDESYMQLRLADGRLHSIACDPGSDWKFEHL